MYKLHGQFTSELIKAVDNRLPNIKDEIRHGLVMDVVYLSRMGLYPEGYNPSDSGNQVAQSALSNAANEQARATPSIIGARPTPAPGQRETVFALSAQSLSRLNALLPPLANCVRLAIRYSRVDFGVSQTIRTFEQQAAAVKAGNSRTMKSKHLVQPDGFAHAVDLVVYENHKITWDFPVYASVACAMDKAATELGIANHVRWGCAWDRVLSDFGGEAKAYLDEAKAYSQRHAGSDLLDAPHFEWVA